MSRYIDADKMIEDTEAMRVISDAITIDGIIKYINENATADVEEVRHGTADIIAENAGIDDAINVSECSCCEMNQKLLPRCGDCHFFEKCSQVCIGLDENETFAEIGGCETFQAADDKTISCRKALKAVMEFMTDMNNMKKKHS